MAKHMKLAVGQEFEWRDVYGACPCPVCGSHGIDFDGMEYDAKTDSLHDQYYCSECGSEWAVVWTYKHTILTRNTKEG